MRAEKRGEGEDLMRDRLHSLGSRSRCKVPAKGSLALGRREMARMIKHGISCRSKNIRGRTPCDEERTHSLLSSYLFLFLPSAILLLRPLCVNPFSPLPSSYTVSASIAYQHPHYLDSGSVPRRVFRMPCLNFSRICVILPPTFLSLHPTPYSFTLLLMYVCYPPLEAWPSRILSLLVIYLVPSPSDT